MCLEVVRTLHSALRPPVEGVHTHQMPRRRFVDSFLNTVFLGSTPIDSFVDKRAPILTNLTTSTGKQDVGFTQKLLFEKKRSETTTI